MAPQLHGLGHISMFISQSNNEDGGNIFMKKSFEYVILRRKAVFKGLL